MLRLRLLIYCQRTRRLAG